MEFVRWLLGDGGKSLLRLLSDGPLSGKRLPGQRVLRNLADETLSGWVTATVTKQWLSQPVAGTLPCSWATRVTQSLTRVFT